MLSVRLRTKWFWVRVQLQSLNHSNADKKVFVVLPDCQSYFSFLHLYEFFWIHNASEEIYRFVQHNLNNPNSLSTKKKKNSEIDATQQKQRKQLILTDSKKFLLNVSNQHNAYNLIL